MKGRYRTLAGLLGFFLMLGLYGCRESKEDAEKDVPPTYRSEETARNEYRVRSFQDPPPELSIESSPRDKAGIGAEIYLRVKDRGKNAGINEVVVFEDGKPMHTINPKGGRTYVSESIHVSRWEGGEHSYHVEATDKGGQKSISKPISLTFSGNIIDPPPTVRFGLDDDGNFELSPHDIGDNSGIQSVTIIEDLVTPVYREGAVSYSTAILSLPRGRKGKHEYQAIVVDNGGNETMSHKITVDFID